MDTLGPFVLSFIEKFSSLHKLNYTSVIEKRPQSLEKFFSIVSLIHCMLYHLYVIVKFVTYQ